MNFQYAESMKSYRAGRLGEQFCKKTFGIAEPTYEIKTNGHRRAMVIVQGWQLFEQLAKQYVIIRYDRAHRSVKHRDGRARPVYTESIEEAFEKPLVIYVIRGSVLARLVVDNKLALFCSGAKRDVMQYGKWGLVYRIPINLFQTEELLKTDKYTINGSREDPPGWMYTEMGKLDGYLPFESEGEHADPGGLETRTDG